MRELVATERPVVDWDLTQHTPPGSISGALVADRQGLVLPVAQVRGAHPRNRDDRDGEQRTHVSEGGFSWRRFFFSEAPVQRVAAPRRAVLCSNHLRESHAAPP